MDRPGVWQVPQGSGEKGKMEKTGCKIICGAPTTLTVKGSMMMMMMSDRILCTWTKLHNTLCVMMSVCFFAQISSSSSSWLEVVWKYEKPCKCWEVGMSNVWWLLHSSSNLRKWKKHLTLLNTDTMLQYLLLIFQKEDKSMYSYSEIYTLKSFLNIMHICKVNTPPQFWGWGGSGVLEESRGPVTKLWELGTSFLFQSGHNNATILY